MFCSLIMLFVFATQIIECNIVNKQHTPNRIYQTGMLCNYRLIDSFVQLLPIVVQLTNMSAVELHCVVRSQYSVVSIEQWQYRLSNVCNINYGAVQHSHTKVIIRYPVVISDNLILAAFCCGLLVPSCHARCIDSFTSPSRSTQEKLVDIADHCRRASIDGTDAIDYPPMRCFGACVRIFSIGQFYNISHDCAYTYDNYQHDEIITGPEMGRRRRQL